MIGNIRNNAKKILTNYGFYVCIFLTVFLCFSAHIYQQPDTQDLYSAIMSLQTFDREFMLRDTSFCSFEVMRKGAGSWLSMFIPIISAFAFIPLVCDEYEAKSVRFEIFRTSRLSYNASRYITACLCGGFAVMLGYILFILMEYAVFPNIGDYDAHSQETYMMFLQYILPHIDETGFFPVILRNLAFMFLYGCVNAAPAIALTSVIRNKYLDLCIPFFLKYALLQTCSLIQTAAVDDYGYVNIKWMKFISIINPDSLAYMTNYLYSNWILIVVYSVSLIFLLGIVYLILQNKRGDCGE